MSVQISGSHEIARKVLASEYDLGLVGAVWNERGSTGPSCSPTPWCSWPGPTTRLPVAGR